MLAELTRAKELLYIFHMHFFFKRQRTEYYEEFHPSQALQSRALEVSPGDGWRQPRGTAYRLQVEGGAWETPVSRCLLLGWVQAFLLKVAKPGGRTDRASSISTESHFPQRQGCSTQLHLQKGSPKSLLDTVPLSPGL